MVSESQGTLSDSFLPPPCYEPGADKGHEKESDDENPPHIPGCHQYRCIGKRDGRYYWCCWLHNNPLCVIKNTFPLLKVKSHLLSANCHKKRTREKMKPLLSQQRYGYSDRPGIPNAPFPFIIINHSVLRINVKKKIPPPRRAKGDQRRKHTVYQRDVATLYKKAFGVDRRPAPLSLRVSRTPFSRCPALPW